MTESNIIVMEWRSGFAGADTSTPEHVEEKGAGLNRFTKRVLTMLLVGGYFAKLDLAIFSGVKRILAVPKTALQL